MTRTIGLARGYLAAEVRNKRAGMQPLHGGESLRRRFSYRPRVRDFLRCARKMRGPVWNFARLDSCSEKDRWLPPKVRSDRDSALRLGEWLTILTWHRTFRAHAQPHPLHSKTLAFGS